MWELNSKVTQSAIHTTSSFLRSVYNSAILCKCQASEFVFTSFGSADLPELWGSFCLRRCEKGACVLQSAAKGHLADLAVRPVAAHFPLVVWQHLRHRGTTVKKGHQLREVL